MASSTIDSASHLTIDSGNTNIVFAVFDDADTIRGEWRSSSHAERTADEFGVWLGQLMGNADLATDDISAAIIASVVPATLFTMKSLCRNYFDCEPLVIGEKGVDLGLEVLIDRPEDVGADRLVNAVAAHQIYDGALVLIDFGTATTFDAIDAEGAYCGGVIAPGINLSLEALHRAAAMLPRIAVEKPARVIGDTTISAMQSGIYWGYVGLIEGLVARIRDEFGAPMKVVATGGLAPLFAEATTVIEHLDTELTLRGLQVIHRRNKTG